MLEGISVIIPSYNGQELLKKCLPFLVEECKRYKGKTEIIVVDDGSIDNTAESIPMLFHEINIIKKEKNKGFAKSVNLGILQAKYPFVFLLNNDIEITPGIFECSANCFEKDDIFAVQGKIISNIADEKLNYINVFYSKYGLFINGYKQIFSEIEKPVEMDFASGGSSMFKRDKFVALNLFDERFSPVYFEDIDICFRAKLFGWKILYHPGIKVYHRDPGMTVRKKFSYFKRKIIHKENYFLFIFKHFLYSRNFSLCLATIPAYILYKLISGDIWFSLGFIKAISRFLRREQRCILTSKNILYIDTPLASCGGGQISLLNIAQNLKSFYPFLIFERETNITKLLKEKGIPFCINKISKVNIFISLLKSIYLTKLIRPRIIHCNSATTFYTFIFALVSKILNIPFIWHVRVIESAGWKDKIIANLSTKIIVISDAVKEKFLGNKNKDKIVKIYNAVDIEKFKPGPAIGYLYKEFKINKNSKIIGLISRLNPWKGHKLFLETAKIIKDKIGNQVIFLIIGTGDEKYKEELIKLTKGLNLAENVIFAGFREDIPEIINFCDVIVNPSVEPEPFGRTIIEAMACGKAVISTNLGGPLEIITDGIDGFLVKLDANELSNVLLKILNDEKLISKIGENARKKVKDKFDLNTQIQEIEKLYIKITKNL